MKKAIFLCLQLFAIVLLSSCTGKDYSELIVGKWVAEYILQEYMDQNNECISTKKYDTYNDTWVFKSDGWFLCNSIGGYDEGRAGITYSITDNILTFNYTNDIIVTYFIQKLNKKTLHITNEIPVQEGDPYTSCPSGTKTLRQHFVFKRI